jgi:hypothetical protein
MGLPVLSLSLTLLSNQAGDLASRIFSDDHH